MDYLTITKKQIEERDLICSPLKKGESVKLSSMNGKNKYYVKDWTTYFMYHQLGMTPYAWQHLAFKQLDSGYKYNIFCTSRQYLGKSTMMAIYALKCAMYNTMATEFTQNRTRIGIIASTEEQSKKLLGDIRNLMYQGDERVAKLTGGKIKNFFTDMIDTTKSSANNKSSITFRKDSQAKGSQIICLPPTDRVRGYTFTVLMLDEAAFFEDDDMFYNVIMPTRAKTDGQVIICSTPNGQKGFYFDLFDPYDTQTDNQFKRMWLKWTHIESETEIEKVKALRDLYLNTGREKQFEQEYEAKFNVAASSFFDADDVDNGIDKSLSKQYHFDSSCDLGVDFGGMVNSQTVVTITTYDKGEIRLLYDYVYPKGKETVLIDDIEKLMKVFKINRIIPDDCAEGDYYIKIMREKGWNVKPMSFRRDKVKKYVQFRAKLRQGKIKYYESKQLIREMKALEEIEGVVNTMIRKPSGGSDDFIDSFLMSCYFYLDDHNKLRFYSEDGVFDGSDEMIGY